jgi:hypothetical protein
LHEAEAAAPKLGIELVPAEVHDAAPSELQNSESALLAQPSARPETKSDLTSAYYDTCTLALYRRGMTLQVRKAEAPICGDHQTRGSTEGTLTVGAVCHWPRHLAVDDAGDRIDQKWAILLKQSNIAASVKSGNVHPARVSRRAWFREPIDGGMAMKRRAFIAVLGSVTA